MSSAEAELSAMVSAASEGLGARAMVRDFGSEIGIDGVVDASAAIGVAQRKELGRTRHLDTQSLWIQDAVREQRVALNTITGTGNPADLLTKHLNFRTMKHMTARLGLPILEGRSDIAPIL